MRKLLLASAALVLLAPIGAAQAAYTFDVWTGSSVGNVNAKNTANFPLPTGLPSAVFSYTGPINFANTNPDTGSNTFGDFFGSNLNGIATASFTSPRGTYLSGVVGTFQFSNATMSTLGDAVDTFIEITGGSYTGPAFTGSIDHDDGGQIFLDGSTTALCGNASEASENTESCAFLPGSHTFAILYTEDNGAPAILKATVPPPSVPEPATLALLGTGLLGLAIGRRRKHS